MYACMQLKLQDPRPHSAIKAREYVNKGNKVGKGSIHDGWNTCPHGHIHTHKIFIKEQ